MIELVVLGAVTAAIRWANTPDGGGAPASAAQKVEESPMMGSEVDGHILAQTLPAKAGDAREAAMLSLAEQGLIAAPDMTEVTFAKGGHTVQMFAAKDALMLGNVNTVRLNARHPTAQRLADFFGLMLPTSLMSDRAWAAAKTGGAVVAPQPGASDAQMSDTSRMIEHSDRVDAASAKAGVGVGSFRRDVGKDWVNSERLLNADGSLAAPVGHIGNASLPAAANFGWHASSAGSKSPGGFPVIQSVGLAHDLNHSDYSQVVTLYGTLASIDGGPLEPIEGILRDPARAFLLSDEVVEGVAARVTRYPAVPAPGGGGNA